MSLGELEKFYTLTPADRNSIAEHRTDSNRLGIAAQLWLKWEAIKLDRRLPPAPRWRPGWVAARNSGARSFASAPSSQGPLEGLLNLLRQIAAARRFEIDRASFHNSPLSRIERIPLKKEQNPFTLYRLAIL